MSITTARLVKLFGFYATFCLGLCAEAFVVPTRQLLPQSYSSRIPQTTVTYRRYMLEAPSQHFECMLVSDTTTLLTTSSTFVQHGYATFQDKICSTLMIGANDVWGAIRSEQHPLQYLFMLPTATMVATCCQLAGIGGAALFSPIFLLIFPLLGPSYPLPTAASAIASALLTEVFGFASGLSGYARRGLVDWNIVLQFMAISVPGALVGAECASTVASNPMLLRGVYALLMMGLSFYLLTSERPDNQDLFDEECDIDDLEREPSVQQLIASDGTEYMYLKPQRGDLKSTGATLSGSALTGLLGVGVGEVVLPQLVRKYCMPLPVAAGTSVAIVVVTALTAAVVQFLSLASEATATASSAGDGGTGLFQGLVAVVPWSLVQFTVPGVLVGGQIAPWLASQQVFCDETIERFAGTLFGIVGLAFGVKCIVG